MLFKQTQSSIESESLQSKGHVFLNFVEKYGKKVWSYEIKNENYFCVRHKNRQKRNQHFKLLFFTINLHFDISNKTSTSRKVCLSQFIFLTSRNVKKTQTDQNKRHGFILCLKRNDPQTFKSDSCRNSFLQCVCYWYNLLR